MTPVAGALLSPPAFLARPGFGDNPDFREWHLGGAEVGGESNEKAPREVLLPRGRLNFLADARYRLADG